MPTELNISLQSTESSVINFIVSNDLQATMELGSVDAEPNISFVTTGAPGPPGESGTPDIGPFEIVNIMLADGVVSNRVIGDNQITGQKISNSSITSNKIGNLAVTTAKIATNAITADKIAPGVVTAELLADGTITADKIPDGAVSQDKLGNGSISTIKILDNAITKAKIAPRTLSGAEIEENVVLDGVKIRGNAQLLGNSPAYFNGPTNDDLHIQSEANLIFKLDTNNNSNNASYIIKNGTDATLFSVDESGNVTINGNVTITGTVDGVDVSSLPTTDTNTQLPLIDDDTMATALSTNVASAESVKAYVDSKTHLELGTTSTTALAGNTTTISTAQANAIVSNTAKVGITNQQASDITSNNAKVSFPGLGTTSTTALAGNTALLQLGTSSTTALAGDTTTISGSQASAITANTAKTGITSQQATDITTNNAKVGITTAQANAITTNTAKVGITTSQADAITANTAKPDLTVDGAGTVHANNYTDTQYSVMGSGNGYAAGLVKAGGILHNNAFLRKDGSWAIPPDTNTTYSEATSSAEGLMSTAHHDKLDGIASGAEVNVQSDWDETDNTSDAFIQNKPTIPAAYTDADAVSAVAAADNYLKNDASDAINGSLTLSQSIFLSDSSSSATGTKSKIINRATTGNRTLDVPDASGTLALTSDIPSFTPNPTVIGQFSTRVSSYWSGRYYYGHASYGWNYFAWNYATTSKTTLDDRFIHVGMVSPITTNNVKVRATVRNDSNTENVELCLLKGSRPNGSSSNVSLTELGSVTVAISTVDLHYNGDINVTNANLSAGDLVFLAVKRISSAANATKYIQVSATIYGE